MADNELEAIFELGEEQEFDCEFKIDATTFDYTTLDNKPRINGEELIGDKSSSDLHLASEQGLIYEIENRQNADNAIHERIDGIVESFDGDIERIDGDITALDEKVDGINVNLTQQIEETQQDLNNKYNELLDDISDLSDTVDDNYDELDGKIDSTANTINQRITDVADELNQTIEENVIALQQEDTALQNQINAHSQTLTNQGQSIANNATAIAQEIINRQNADDNLQDQIDNLRARGRFLSLWNATTGLAETDPEIDPYPYNTGDYFIVGTVGETNYKPTGAQYVIGQPSTELETEELATEDVYYFDGSVWHLQVNHGKTVSFANLAGQPSDNTALKNVLDSKQATLVSGTNIKTLNNQSLLGSGDIEIKATPDLDNLTVSLNSESKIQSIGSILQSGGYQKYWQGTKAEYEAITNKDDNTLYEVLDDIVDVVTEIPTATVNDIGLVKPDNATITVDDTGTISVKSSFANMNLSNVSNAYDWAIYSITYGGGESGYTKYRNKRLEQWGVTNASANGESEITMHLPFKDVNYSVFIEIRETGDFLHYAIPSGVQKFKVRVKGANGNFYGAKFQWRAYGYYE